MDRSSRDIEGAGVDREAAAGLRRELGDGVARRGLSIDQVVARSGLGRTTVSLALNSTDRVPSARTVAKLARVLQLDERRLLELRMAATNTASAVVEGVGKPISECDPLDLEVHPAGERRESPSGLPGYVPREHDVVLADVVEAARAEGRSGMAVLVGWSSTGKTRACWEAVRPLAEEGWRLWHPYYPTNAEAVLAGLEHVRPRTVIWLNEAQRYLDRGEETAAAIHAVLTDSDRAPVLVLCTLWPDHEERYRARPRSGQPDTFARARELLAGRCVTVPDEFDEKALREAERLAAEGDAFLTRVLSRDHRGRIAQHLAGAPALLRRYEGAEPSAKAVLHAAIDARRLGVELYLPLDFLAGAALGYMDPDDVDALPDNWLERALEQLGEPVHGNLAPLRRVRQRPQHAPPGECLAGVEMLCPSPLYRLADVLEEHGRRTRRLTCPPRSFWFAAHAHFDDARALALLGKAARDRYRLQWADALYRRAVAGDDPDAMCELARMREDAGDLTEALALYWQAANAGRIGALCSIAQIWAFMGRLDDAEELALHAADAGQASGLCDVAWARLKAGDGAGAEALYRRAADAGDLFAMNEVACMREEAGDPAEAEHMALRAADAGNPYTVSEIVRRRELAGDSVEAERLALLAVERGSADGLSELARMRAQTGRHIDAEAFYQRAADAGNTSACYELALIRELAGDQAEADALYRRANESSGEFVTQNLLIMRERAGASEEAEQIARRAAENGQPIVLSTLARMREQAGALDEAHAMYRRAAEAGDTVALREVALACETAGDHAEADRLALLAANAGDSSVIRELARKRCGIGEWDPAFELRYGLDPEGTPSRPWRPTLAADR